MIRTLLVGTDASSSAMLAVEEASNLARAHDAGLLVLYVRPPLDAREVFDPDGVPDVDTHVEELIVRLDGARLRIRRETGDPAETICHVAKEENVDVIVVGNRGAHGRRRRFLGSVPSAVVQHAPCSVFIVDTRVAQ